LPPQPTAETNATTAATAAIAAAGAATTAGGAANTARDTATVSRLALAALPLNAPAQRLAAATSAANDAQAAATAAQTAVGAVAAARPLARTAAREARVLLRVAQGSAAGLLRARFPGAAGNTVVRIRSRLSRNGLSNPDNTGNRLSQVHNRDIVFIRQAAGNGLFQAELSGGGWSFRDGGTVTALASLDATADQVQRVLFTVEIDVPGAFPRTLTWSDLTLDARDPDSVGARFGQDIPNRARELQTPIVLTGPADVVGLARALIGSDVLAQMAAAGFSSAETRYELTGGNDGVRPTAEEYRGAGGDPGVATVVKSGLVSFEDIDEISIVAAPGLTFGANNGYAAMAQAATEVILSHVQRMRYRVAVLDSPDDQAVSQVRQTRAVIDERRAAMYYPWVSVLDPVTRERLNVPPSGFVTGIYARNDIERGVSKAPANEVVTGAIGLETLVNKAQQEVLNPDGINCIRLFENRGFRVWGARTLSSDPEWKYVNVMRYFVYLEHSIDRGTQWAVFESNGEALWANVRRTIEDFLFGEWRTGALLGSKPEEAFFVRVDRSTMAQTDLDNGRLICQIGVAVVKPAEFVIFRIGQMTADSRR
jgi:hypothetical protein